jgi:hypothetical protein
MHNIIDMVIEREVEMLDAIVECPELIDGPAYFWTPTRTRLNPMTRKFSTRGTRRSHVAKSNESMPRYLN